jgi:hypothetical protein
MSVVQGERSLRLWTECFVPIDDRGARVGQPLRLAIPLTLESTLSLDIQRSGGVRGAAGRRSGSFH